MLEVSFQKHKFYRRLGHELPLTKKKKKEKEKVKSCGTEERNA